LRSLIGPKRKANEIEEPRDERGLKTRYDPPTPDSLSDPPVNIVFVHGLGGSASGTWTDDTSNSFWPLWLPEIDGLANARIMTFGYKSDYMHFWEPKNALGIHNFANQLADDLSLYLQEHQNVPHSSKLR
jgi:hypothetical protein